jgi:hypothetical protein
MDVMNTLQTIYFLDSVNQNLQNNNTSYLLTIDSDYRGICIVLGLPPFWTSSPEVRLSNFIVKIQKQNTNLKF